GEFEKVIRRHIKRGTIQVQLRCLRPAAASDFQINAVALRSYLSQVKAAAEGLGLPNGGGELLAQVLALPGGGPEPANASLNLEDEWPILESTLEQAIARMQQMRLDEGKAMAAQLLQLRDHIAGQLTLVRSRAPHVAENYRGRLLDRVRTLMGELDVQV